YTGAANLRDVTVEASKPKILFIGLEGAGKTIIDGGLANYGWLFHTGGVVSSLTFQKVAVALAVESTTSEVRFVDLVVRDNIGPSWAAGVYVNSAAKVHISSSTFVNNTGVSGAEQIWFGAGSATMVNTAVWGTSTGTLLAKASGVALTTSYSF